MSFKPTPLEEIPQLVARARSAHAAGIARTVEWRKGQLRALHRMVVAEKSRIEKALHLDLHKNTFEGYITEVAMVISDIATTLESLDKWVKPTYPSVPLLNAMDGCQIRYDPLGVVLIIGAWNYPIQLTLVPLVGAIAAGNTAIVKPSEISPHTAELLAELVPKYLDPSAFIVVNGGVTETSKLLEERFDHILYTGNSFVGKIVMAAAAKYLTPVTLELGGKSPTIVLDGADPVVAARRITWGRFSNAGQTCIAPDYILCSSAMEKKLIPEIAKAVKEFYGEDSQKSENFGRIVNKNHWKRVSGLIEADKVAIGGKIDEADLYIAPTVLTGVNGNSPSMQQEIFGPVLPIVNVDNVDQAIKFVNEREKPLALYVFGRDQKAIEKVLTHTSSGSALVNDCLMQASIETLPFGGVGNSGMGAYHGHNSFLLFSHKKSVMKKDENLEFINTLRYPPYSEKKTNMLQTLVFKSPSTSYPWISGFGIVGVAAAVLAYLL